MTDNTNTGGANPAPGNTPPTGDGKRGGCCGRGARRRGLALAAFAVATGLIGFGIGKATGHHRFGHAFGMHRTVDADTILRQTDAGINRVLGKVDATAEQKSKAAEITRAAINDLMPLRNAHTAVRDKLVVALKADKIDRAVIEQLRTEELALAETLSKRAAQALADVAEILTPAQRGKLVENWQARMGRG
jgi:Spy/CpxP family protein refolding chaperone